MTPSPATRAPTFAVLLLATISGCHSANNPPQQRGPGARVTAADLKFETSQDPPIKAQTHFAAGQLAESQNDVNRAVEQYWVALKLDPKCKEALFRLGVLYSELKHYPEAIVAWKQYVKVTDGDATGYSNLAFCYELSGKPADAEDAYQKGIARDPKNNPCRVNYGLMLARHDRITEATLQLQAVLTPAEVHYNLASVFEQQGRKDQARAEYRKALDLDPTLADAEARLSLIK